MKTARLIAAILLAIPLIFFGGNYFVHFFELPPPEEMNPGIEMIVGMRESGLMGLVAFAHLLCGILLLIPKYRFLGALLHLPLSIGMVGFHLFMMPEGLAMVFIILILNIISGLDMEKIKSLV